MLRLRGVFLAIATIGFVEAMRLGVILNLADHRQGPGLKNPNARPGGGIVTIWSRWLVAVRRLAATAGSAAWAAIRQDELAAASQGIHVARYKMNAFVPAR